MKSGRYSRPIPKRRWRVVAFVLEVEQVVADLCFIQAVRRRMEVDCELPYGTEINILGALAKTGELKVLVHLLAECGGHDWFLGQRVEINLCEEQ